MPRKLLMLGLMLVSLSGLPAFAENDRTILTIHGPNGQLGYTRTTLALQGMVEIKTTTPWTEGEVTFRGVLAHDVFKTAKIDSGAVHAIALNDYKVEIPVADFEKYGVLLAMEMNGSELTVREKGPIWIIYPDSTSDHTSATLRSRMVWQLKELRAL